MTAPHFRCGVCGTIEIVRPDGRGFPPDIARRRIEKRCKASGHECVPIYRAGIA
jgi:hypothetical protein